MALKADRVEDRYAYDLSWYMDEVAERGGIVVASTVGSGSAMDQSRNVVTYAVNPSGSNPVGMLLNDVVNKDLTQQTLQRLKAEQIVGGKVTVNGKGSYVTNMIYPGLTIAAQDNAYLTTSGLLTNAIVNNEVNTPYVGQFRSTKDADGYAKVVINLPSKA